MLREHIRVRRTENPIEPKITARLNIGFTMGMNGDHSEQSEKIYREVAKDQLLKNIFKDFIDELNFLKRQVKLRPDDTTFILSRIEDIKRMTMQ